MIFDSHTHLESVPLWNMEYTAEDVIALMDRYGIEKAAVSGISDMPGVHDEGLEDLYEATKKYPGRFYPYVRLNPNYVDRALEIMDKAVKEYGFVGVKLHPVCYCMLPWKAPTLRILERAAEYDIPVLFHCSDEPFCYPLEIAEAAARCPETKIIMAHMGGFYHFEDALRACEKHPNLYIDTSETMYPEKIAEAVRRIGAERILFGSDLPADNPAVEIEKIKSLRLPKEDEDRIFYKNIAGLLKVEI